MSVVLQPNPLEIITNSLGMKLVLIPASKFMMGSSPSEEGRGFDETQHKVTLSKGFYMGVYQVTQEQWQAIMGNNPSHFKGERNLPVEKVSWDDCQEFLRKLSDQDGHSYRLPTEAEWECACRAGTTAPFYFGHTISTNQANYDGNYPYGNSKKGIYRQKTTPVGSFPGNAWGLYDMHGNVWEWCQDGYDPNYYKNSPREDPPGPAQGSRRVIRGGGWDGDGLDCRSAVRSWSGRDSRGSGLGFRVAAVQSWR